MPLKEAFEKLGDAIDDLSSLEVLTFTGDMQVSIQGDGAGNLIDWDKLVAEAKPDGTVKLVLASKFEADGDAKLFKTLGDVDPSIRAAHDEAVRAGQQVRKDLMELFGSTVQSLVK